MNPGINFSGTTRFKVVQGETFTVPDNVTAPSPTNASSGVSPVTTFDARRQVAYATVYAAFNDAAGPTDLTFDGLVLQPGDVLILGSVVSNAITVTLNGVLVYTITGVTAVGGLLGAYA